MPAKPPSLPLGTPLVAREQTYERWTITLFIPGGVWMLYMISLEPADNPISWILLGVTLLMLSGMIWYWRALRQRLDHVSVDEAGLHLRRGEQDIHIRYADIASIDVANVVVTLHLRCPTPWGTHVTFRIVAPKDGPGHELAALQAAVAAAGPRLPR